MRRGTYSHQTLRVGPLGGLEIPPEDSVGPGELWIPNYTQSKLVNSPEETSVQNHIDEESDSSQIGDTGDDEVMSNQDAPPTQDNRPAREERFKQVNLFKLDVISHVPETCPDERPTEDVYLASRLQALGKSFVARFSHQKEPDYIHKALICFFFAVLLTPYDHPTLAGRLDHLGLLHVSQFHRTGEESHSKKAIAYLERANALTPEDHPELPRRLNSLGILYESLFWRSGRMDYNTKAIQHKSHAVRLIRLTTSTSSDVATRFESLGTLYEARFRDSNELSDLNNAIDNYAQAVNSSPRDDKHRPRRLERLGLAYRTRSVQRTTNSLDDIYHAIKYIDSAISCTIEGDPNLSRRFSNLGMAYETRFRRLGEQEDSNKAIDYKRKALDLVSQNEHPEKPNRLEYLGVSYVTRFEHFGQSIDIQLAVEMLDTAVQLTEENHSALSRRLINLAVAHAARFDYTRQEEDNDKAIQYLERAEKLTGKDYPGMSSLLNNLGMSYKTQFEHHGDIGERLDIDKAIDYLSRSLDLTAEGHSDRAMRLDNLGMGYKARYQQYGELEDLQEALKFCNKAVQQTPKDHPDRPRQLTNLGLVHALLSQEEPEASSSHFTNALMYFREAAKSQTMAPPREKFRAARSWAELIVGSEPGLNSLEPIQVAIDLIPHLVLLGTTRHQRYHVLREMSDLAVEAVYAAIHACEYDLAVEWLEQTRCVVWNQNLTLQSNAPLDQLRSAHPGMKLISRFQDIMMQMQTNSIEAPNTIMRGTPSALNNSLDEPPHPLVNEYNSIVWRVREFPEFEDFLRPKKASELVHAAQIGPVIILNCYMDCCDALVIRPGSSIIEPIPLPNPQFTYEEAESAYWALQRLVSKDGQLGRGMVQSKASNTPKTFEEILGVLWEKIVMPILDFLGYRKRLGRSRLPHITWCLTGIMTFLPLHAAGNYHSKPQARVFDYAISSYTPTLTSILYSNQPLALKNSSILLVGVENTPKFNVNPLHGTKEELKAIRDSIKDTMTYSELVDQDATTTSVLEKMSQNEWVHLACHACQDPSDATKSGFLLYNDILDLATIAEKSFKSKGLAFLSACETATGDKGIPDEAVHLASCMLMAGYPSVIATMWTIGDQDAAFVAKKVYSQLTDGGKIEKGRVAEALHNAVEALRQEDGVEIGDWIQFIHMGF